MVCVLLSLYKYGSCWYILQVLIQTFLKGDGYYPIMDKIERGFCNDGGGGGGGGSTVQYV